MDLKVYRQASYERKDGITIYRGEDALPYVDDRMFLVADGLGGAAAIRHSKVNRGVFDSNTIVDTLFHDVFDEGYDDPRFVKYVKETFSEILDTGETYFSSASDIKKSGYFASRITSALFLHMLLYDWKDIELEKGFDDFFDNYGENEQKVRLEKLGDSVAEKLRKQLIKVAENANLIYETSIEGLTLLGTTLCATVYSEDENTVHAGYYVAGDSRPYVWTLQDGLTQLMLDQEQADGGMTNCISINSKQPFGIKVAYYAFPKKCILFNASDGCFDSHAFINQMAFEKKILDAIALSSNMEAVAENLTEFFTYAGKHDDSSTIAMKVFGYDSFEDLQNDCNERLKNMDEVYFSKMADLLSKDYRAEYQKEAKVDPTKLQDVKKKFGDTIQVKELCRTRVTTEKYQPYLDAMEAIEEEIKVCRKRCGDAFEDIETVVSENYLKYYTAWGNELGRWDRSLIKQERDEQEFADASRKYNEELEERKKSFDDAVEQIRKALEGLYSLGIPESHEAYEVIDFKVLDECDESMDELFKYFEALRKNKYEIVRRIYTARKKYVDRNIKLAEENADLVQGIVNHIITEGFIEDVNLLPQEVQKIQDALKNIEKLQICISEHEAEKEKVADEMAEKYWEQYFEKIIRELIADDSIQMDESIMADARELFAGEDPELKILKEKAEMQEELFAKYNKGYNKYLEDN